MPDCCAKKDITDKLLIIKMVGPAGFEPATSSTPRKRPTKLSYGPRRRKGSERKDHFATYAERGKLESGKFGPAPSFFTSG